jgi:hypothetical protein
MVIRRFAKTHRWIVGELGSLPASVVVVIVTQ